MVVKRLGLCLAVATGLSFLPTPAFEFVPTAEASTSPLPGLTEASPGRVIGGEEKTDAFSLVGVSLEDEPVDPVRVRVLDPRTGWTQWEELEMGGDDGPDLTSAENSSHKAVSEPYLHVDAVGYQFELAAEDAAGADVTLVRDGVKRAVVDATPLGDASVQALFPIHKRSEWGAAAYKNGTPNVGDSTKLAVVHHTAGQNNYAQGSVPGIIRGIQAYHQGPNGWDDIGYNFLVDRFGGIWEGRSGSLQQATVGAHAQGFNTGSVGISVLGDYTKASPTSVAVESVSKVAAWRLWENDTPTAPDGTVNFKSGGSPKYAEGVTVNLPRIVGHRDVGLTSCPGSIHAHLPAIRTKAKSYFNKWTEELAPIGVLDPLGVEEQTVTIQGWAQVPTTEKSVVVHVSINDKWRIVTANLPRPDVSRARPGLRSNVGFKVVVDDVPKDTLTKVCAYGISQGTAGSQLLGCRYVVVK